ncbi:MAG TPA: hypothetical protein VIK04_10895 [Solirubrobacteraceae bacterium]
MSKHFATTAVRRRWGVCATYARQHEASWPRRAREKARAGVRGDSTYSYLALVGEGDSRSLELAILKLIIGNPKRSQRFPVAALREAFEPIRPTDFDAALALLEQHGAVIRRGELIRLARHVQHLVDLGFTPRV